MKTTQSITINYDSLKPIIFADSITCDVIVKNPEKDDKWTELCLRSFNRNAFLDTIFNQLYSGRLIAYDYDTHLPLTIKEIRKIEETTGYSRSIIGKFQFNEQWQYDPEKKIMMKKVHSIIFGYENYTEDGFVKGYKPLFKIKLE
jgi:hypothetical protein